MTGNRQARISVLADSIAAEALERGDQQRVLSDWSATCRASMRSTRRGREAPTKMRAFVECLIERI